MCKGATYCTPHATRGQSSCSHAEVVQIITAWVPNRLFWKGVKHTQTETHTHAHTHVSCYSNCLKVKKHVKVDIVVRVLKQWPQTISIIGHLEWIIELLYLFYVVFYSTYHFLFILRCSDFSLLTIETEINCYLTDAVLSTLSST